MSGHSKWSTIKRKKGSLDARRSKMFTRAVKEIMVAVKVGGSGDVDANARLRIAIQIAKGVNMPKENIQRAIDKAQGGESLEEYTFEGYGPCGIPVFIECLTNNTNRSIKNVRLIFSKHGGTIGTIGSLSFVYQRKGVFEIIKSKVKLSTDDFEMALIDAGVEDIAYEDDTIIVTCPFEDFGSVQKTLDDLKIEIENADLQRIPNEYKTLNLEDSLRVMKFIDALEDDEDVTKVFHALAMTDELANEL
jgi:YebC/PmpR family DNA-binding regulatory protein